MKIQKLSILLLFILFITACSKEKAEGSCDPTNNTFKGNIFMYDEGLQAIDKSGVNVLLESSGTVIGRAVSDSKGEFTIPVAKAVKEFILTLSKPGMGDYKEYYQVTSDNKIKKFYVDSYINADWNIAFQLGSKSTVAITNLTAEITNGRLVINFTTTSSASEGQKSARFLIQKDLPNISINTVSQDVYSIGNLYTVTTGENTIESCLSCFTDCRNYKSGDKIYLTAYGESTYTNGYTDPETRKSIFPNLNVTSNNTVVSVIIP